MGTVREYVEKFEELVQQLLAYEPMTASIYFTTRFIEGLKAEIRAGVMVQRPQDLVTATVLATFSDMDDLSVSISAAEET
ncbi:hypothetical protein E2562_006329 [Oryza meyeriana var. granulata]|uniref:Retrotransposon gag domain-containing protein n=1 Tax=Oryza meyeriana var. granulata TaxID=110450 RepID=A0A6G1EF61_9ORYZ|nr:hypothetical protein E2562_006329 [Oryza meyeriana var. granulata]